MSPYRGLKFLSGDLESLRYARVGALAGGFLLMLNCNGRHNRIKVLSFCLLNGVWRDSKELAFKVDSSPPSLRTLLVRWNRWGFVTLHMDGEGTRRYQLTAKGLSWLEKHWREFPLSRWIQAELPVEKREYFSFLWRD